MEDVIQLTRDMYKFGYIVMIKVELLEFEEMFNIGQGACEEVINADHMKSLADEAITEMGTNKPGSAGK